MVLVLFIIGFILAVLSALVEDGRLDVALVSASSLLWSLGLFLLIIKIDKKFYVYKFYIFFHVLQPLFLLIFILVEPNLAENIMGVTSLYTGDAHTLFYSFMMVPLIGAIFAFFVSNSASSGYQFTLQQYSIAMGNRLNFLLIVGAVSTILIWFVFALPGVFGYLGRIFSTIFSFTAFVAGLYFRRSSLVRYSWWIILIIGVIFAVLTGSRGYAFWPLLLYAVGFLIQLRPGIDRRVGYSLFLLSLPLGVFLIGFIQQFRSEVGRRPLGEVEFSEVIQAIPTALGNTLAKGNESYSFEVSGTATGLSRLVDSTLVFVPNMNPEPVPYRGYQDYSQELAGIFYLGGSDLRNLLGSFYPTQMFARNYGFNVYAEADEQGRQVSTTVPFAVVADSWSRWGLASTVFQVSILIMFLIVFEHLNRQLFARRPELMVFGFFFLCDSALRFATVYGLTRTFRQAILYYSAVIIATSLLLTLRNFFFHRASQSNRLQSYRK